MSAAFLPYLAIVEYVIALLCNLSTCCRLPFVIVTQLRAHRSPDFPLTAFSLYLTTVLLEALAGLVHYTYLSVFWRPQNGYSTNGIFFSGVALVSLIPVNPVAAFTVTLDRLASICAPRTRHPRILMPLAATLFVAMAGVNAGLFASGYPPHDGPTTCWAIGCVVGSFPSMVYICSKLAFGALNACTGAVFLLALWRIEKRTGNLRAGSKRRSDVLVLVTIAADVVFNFVPHSTDMLVRKATEFKYDLSTFAGPYSSFLAAIHAAIVTDFYSRNVRAQQSPKGHMTLVQVSQVPAAASRTHTHRRTTS